MAISPVLCLRDISLAFGGISALTDVSFEVPTAAVTGVIGPNGAGKTSLFNCVSGLYRQQKGDIRLNGFDVSCMAPAKRASRGLARTFQNIALFESLTVLENVELGANAALRPSLMSSLLPSPESRRMEREAHQIAVDSLEWVGIAELTEGRVDHLTFAARKKVELARAIAAKPTLIMLDEPAGGLSWEAVQSLGTLIRRLVDEKGISVLLIEHHLNLVMDVSQHVIVLNFGRKICEGTPADVRRDQAVVHAYLGHA
jgi:branched-chain amino acid transport system ATP-binding protein